ncbi:MAG: hypothetical protein F4Z79_04110 [Acidimicrobiia bacterium]|nr:hypothetical protein [Acidimicrobiia bacterium]MYB78482.1 hypothetical protein [Acidimicrobiia bacterium]
MLSSRGDLRMSLTSRVGNQVPKERIVTTSGRSRRVLVGLALVAVGGAFLVENLTEWEVPWASWWPLIIIAVGLGNLKQKSWLAGLFVTALGVFFLLSTLDIWDYSIGDVWRFWPVVLILVGARILFGRRKKRSRHDPHSVRDDSVPGEVNVTSVFRSDSRKVTDRSISGGQVVAVFGSVDINLAEAGLAGGEATLDVTVVFGGAEIRVPENWSVDIQTTNLLGGVEDKRPTPPSGSSEMRLTLTGVCLFGGIEVES